MYCTWMPELDVGAEPMQYEHLAQLNNNNKCIVSTCLVGLFYNKQILIYMIYVSLYNKGLNKQISEFLTKWG